MAVHLTTQQLGRLLESAAKVGAESALVTVGSKPSLISQRQAFRSYGEMQVRRWVKLCWVKPASSGESKNSKIKYSVIELEIANTKSIHEKSTDHIKK